MLRQISLGSLGLSLGGILTVIGFVAYFNGNATLNLAGFFYGIPLLLGGLALKAAELKPITYTQQPTEVVLQLRDRQATTTQNQVRQDVMRYRYGQEAHLDSTLKHLGLSPTDDERPILTGLREVETEGAYTLVLEFDSPLMPLEKWVAKQDKMNGFFGPGVRVAISQPQESKIELALIATDSNRTEAATS